MKKLYKTVVENLEGWTPSSAATAAELEAAELKLGVPLPRSFRRFALEVGGAAWPVFIHGVQELARTPADLPHPPFLLAFADDGGGNEWCFDTRALRRQEYPIVFWDHEDPPSAAELAEPAPPTSFDAWLEDQVGARVDDGPVARALAARRLRIEEALLPHRGGNAWPWAPSDDDVARVEADIGFALPRDYVWFTTHLGSTRWPLHIPDVLEVPRLTAAMQEAFPATPPASKIAVFAREADGSGVAFQSNGKPVTIGGPLLKDRTFFDFLERRINERSPNTIQAKNVDRAAVALAAKQARAAAAQFERDTGLSATLEGPDDPPLPNDRVTSVWRTVAAAGDYTATPVEGNRVKISMALRKGGKHLIFVSAAEWLLVKARLEAGEDGSG